MSTKEHIKTIEEAFKCYYRPLNLFALHYVNDIDSAEDIVQQCFSDLWEKQCQNRDIGNLKAYLFTSVRNQCIDFLKKDTVISHDVEVDSLDNLSEENDEEERAFREARLWTAIDSLPDRCREIFLMNKKDGMKYKEIAEKTGLSVNTVENHVLKALRLLREKAGQIYYFLFG